MVIQKIRNKIPANVTLLKEHEIVRIFNFESRYLIARTSEQNLVKSKVIVLAIPWNAVKKIQFVPAQVFSRALTRIQPHQPFVIFFIAAYKSAVWHQMDCYIFDYISRMHCFECSPNTLAGAIYCNINDVPIDVKTHILNILAQHFECLDMLFPQNFQFSIVPQAVLINFPDADLHDAIIWASTNSAITFRGFLNGAVQSALQASVLALTILRPSLISISHLRSIGFTKYRCCQTRMHVNFAQRFLLSLNIVTLVDAMKIFGFGFIIFNIYTRYYKPWIKSL